MLEKDKFIEWMRNRKVVSESTISKYLEYIGTVERDFDKHADYMTITEMKDYKRNRSSVTRSTYRRGIRTYLEFLEDDEWWNNEL